MNDKYPRDINKKIDTVLEINKEKFKKTIDIYYSNQANFDKLVITIHFAEIGFLIHSINLFEAWLFFPIFFGCVGISMALYSYKIAGESLAIEKQRIESEMLSTVGFDGFEETITKLDLALVKAGKIATKVDRWVIYFLGLTSLTTVEAFYFMKNNIHSNWCFILSGVCTLFIFLIITFLGKQK